MPTYIRRPDHPKANQFGMIDRNDLGDEGYQSGLAPNVIRDEMEPTRHMATGEWLTSKSKFREMTRASGCVEVGNDSSLTAPRKPVQLDRGRRIEDIKRAIHQLRNGG